MNINTPLFTTQSFKTFNCITDTILQFCASFVYVLTEQPNCQLQNQHAKKENNKHTQHRTMATTKNTLFNSFKVRVAIRKDNLRNYNKSISILDKDI